MQSDEIFLMLESKIKIKYKYIEGERKSEQFCENFTLKMLFYIPKTSCNKQNVRSVMFLFKIPPAKQNGKEKPLKIKHETSFLV